MAARRLVGRLGTSFVLVFGTACGPGPETPAQSPTPAASSAATKAEAPKSDPKVEPPTGARIEVPGTGITMVAPRGVALDPVGSSLEDPSGEVVITIAVGPSRRNLLSDPAWRQLYPSPPETVQVGTKSGTLVHRLRSRDGGEFDGWSLHLSHGDRTAMVIATLRGEPNDARFAELKRHLLTVDWRPEEHDMERAFGVSPGKIVDMQTEQEAAGGMLMYESKDGARVTAQPVPGPTPPDFAKACGANLKTIAAGSFKGFTFGEPEALTGVGASGCELSAKKSDGAVYVAFLAPKTGGMLLLLGEAPPEKFDVWLPRFKAAARALKPTR